MDSNLNDLIKQIYPTGSNGFEGLIAELLTEFTGKRFHLSRSGSQAGKDASLRQINANIVAVECKRYGKDTEFNEVELQGKMAQAVMSTPYLDLWVLVTSRNVPSQLYEALHQQAQHENIEFLSISADDGEPSSLEILFAQAPEKFIAFFESNISKNEKRELEQLFKNIRDNPNYNAKFKHLKEEFLLPYIGYDNWCSSQNQWFAKCISSEKESRAHFSQPLNVREVAATLIPRESAQARLDKWFSNWKKNQIPFVMLGEEGDGKTWSVASWIDKNIQNQIDFPAVVFLPSQHVETNEPLTLLSKIITHYMPTLREDDWKRRIIRWTEKSAVDSPKLLLVLDGINERRNSIWWRELIEQLIASPWCYSVAVIITCRSEYWQRYFGKLRHIENDCYELSSYDDTELNIALDYHNLSILDISDELLPLIRKPRYFELMVTYRDRLVESGDFTKARLIYEDWRDRLNRKGFDLDDDAFQNLIKDLASTNIKGQNYLRERDIDNLLPSYEDKKAIIEELRTGGILQSKDGSLKVDENRLIYGFGLLLVDQIRRQDNVDKNNIWEEVIANWLEPRAEMDIKGQICEFAALHALSISEVPNEAKIALLNVWLNSHNPGEKAAVNFTSYYPLDPHCYFGLAEIVWSDVSNNHWAQELLMDTFLRWINVSHFTHQLSLTFERWLGYVNIYGEYYQRGKTDEDAEKLRQEICDRVGYDLKPGPFTFANRHFIATNDDGLLRLGRFSLTLISHLPRGPFIRAIATGCVAEAIMGTPAKYDLFKWVISTSPQSVWMEVKKEVELLLESDYLVTEQASYRLLSFEGSYKAHKLQKIIPDNIFPPNRFYELYKKDPCTSIFSWSQEESEICIQRKDLSPEFIAKRLKYYCTNPDLSTPNDLGKRLESIVEQINPKSIWSLMTQTEDDFNFSEWEPSLCAYSPHTIADFLRRIVCQTDLREGLSLRQLALKLKEHFLIFKDKEFSSIYKAWYKLNNNTSTLKKNQKYTEMFLFRSVLKILNAREQLAHLLELTDEALDRKDFEHIFLPLNEWEIVSSELSSLQNIKRIERTLWFISTHPENIPKSFIYDKISPFLKHENSVIRGYILKILYFTKYKEVINTLIEEGWSWDKSFCFLENHWGNLLVCEHGDSLSYPELRNRIHPSYLGYAIKCRGMLDNEINQYAEDIHHIWSKIGEKHLPLDFPDIDMEFVEDVTKHTHLHLSSSNLSKSITFKARNSTWGGLDTDNKIDTSQKDVLQQMETNEKRLNNLLQIIRKTIEEQVQAGNYWFAQKFYTSSLEQVLNRRPELISEWVEYVLVNTDEAVRRLQLARSFYDALCKILLQQEHELGISLYWRLINVKGGISVVDSRTELWMVDFSLFKAKDTDKIRDTWKLRLGKCTSDKEIMQIALLAQSGNGKNWIQSYIYKGIYSSAPLERSRAFTLLGFVEKEETFKFFNELQQNEPDTWINELLKTSLRRWQRNDWAKHWYRRFLTINDNVLAWAAFRLFLQCVDSRFWYWNQIIQSEVDSKSQSGERITFLNDNLDTIKKRIKKNEEPLKNHLFGQKIKSRQAWPWM